jgi:hypothetical protein
VKNFLHRPPLALRIRIYEKSMVLPAKRRALLGGLTWGLVSASAAATSGESSHRIEVDCAALERPAQGDDGTEWRATFETRALVTLSVADAPPGALRLRCDAGSAVLRWEPEDGTPRQLPISVPFEPPALIELSIAALWQLLEAPPTGQAPPPEPPPPRPTLRNLGPLAELAVEAPWADSWGSLGGRFGLVWSPYLPLRTSLWLGARSALEAPSGFGTRYLDAGLGGELSPIAGFPAEFGALFFASLCEVAAPASAAPSNQRALAATLVARARLRWASDTGGVALGPEGLLHLLRPRIVVDDLPLAGVPVVALGFSATFWSYLW